MDIVPLMPTIAVARVLIVLLAHQNQKTGRCDPSVSTIAEEADLLDRRVIRALRRLENDGLVTLDRRPGRSTQYSFPFQVTADTAVTTTSDTRVTTNEGSKGNEKALIDTPPLTRVSPPPLTRVDATSDTAVTQTTNNTEGEHRIEHRPLKAAGCAGAETPELDLSDTERAANRLRLQDLAKTVLHSKVAS